MNTTRFTEICYPLVCIHADSVAAGEVNSGYVALRDYNRAVVLIDVGDMGSSATFDVDIEQATDTSGTSAKAITGKSITQLTQAGGDSDDILAVEIMTDELDVDNGFDCINAEVTVGTAAVECSVWIIGFDPRFAPVSTTAWTEVVT